MEPVVKTETRGVSNCLDADYRNSLSDDDFWAYVLLGERPEDFDEPDLDEVNNQDEPCDECGEMGPCGYDQIGRPLFHAKPSVEGEMDDED